MLEATLEVDRYSTRCSNCRMPASPYDKAHDLMVGYGDTNGKPGCGAVFTAITSVVYYGDDYDIKDRLAAMRPDLPIVGVDFTDEP